MELINKIFKDDISKYEYILKSEKDRKNYQVYKIICFMMAFSACLLVMILTKTYTYISIVLLMSISYFGYKFPFVMLKLRHNQKSNDVISAIPLWVNIIYSLIGENNIYNSIALSYDDVPQCLKSDLKIFIDKITKDNDDKNAYVEFLSKYEIEGFRDVMMKLFEFRNLSKDKLKYEIYQLNKSLGNLEKIKREKRFKSELFVADILTVCMIGIPCLYMFFVSLLLSEMLM